jgi:hypothetical protein
MIEILTIPMILFSFLFDPSKGIYQIFFNIFISLSPVGGEIPPLLLFRQLQILQQRKLLQLQEDLYQLPD